MFQIPSCWVQLRRFLYLLAINCESEGWLLNTPKFWCLFKIAVFSLPWLNFSIFVKLRPDSNYKLKFLISPWFHLFLILLSPKIHPHLTSFVTRLQPHPAFILPILYFHLTLALKLPPKFRGTSHFWAKVAVMDHFKRMSFWKNLIL